MRSGSSCPLGEVLEHSEKVGPGGGVAYIYIYFFYINWFAGFWRPTGAPAKIGVEE